MVRRFVARRLAADPLGPTPAELAGGFGLPGATPLAGRIEDSFARQLDALSEIQSGGFSS
jgi:hypothetical protein